MTQKQANFVLLSVSIAWGSSNLMLRLGLEGIETFNLIALRFGLAFILVAILLHKKIRHTPVNVLLYSALLGLIVYSNFVLLIWALRLSTVSEVSFLTSMSVVLVLLLCSIQRRRMPDANLMVAVAVVFAGFALMNLEHGFRLSLGTLFSLAAALASAIVVVLTDHISHRIDSMVQLGVWETGFTGLFGLITSILFETPKWPQTKVQWFAVLVLALVCSAYGFVMRTIAQKYTPPEQVGFLLSLEPVFSALFGFLILHERLTVSGYIGAALVLISAPIANKAFPVPWAKRNLRSPHDTKE